MNNVDLDDFSVSPEEEALERKSSRKLLFAFLGVVVTLAIALAVAVGGFAWKANDAYVKNTDFVPIRNGQSQVDKGKGTNILLIGSDRRNPEEAAAQNVSGQRADVLMLVHVNAAGDHAYVTSFPRDLYIDIPGHGKGRINSALSHGGVALQVQAVENYVGSQIDHAALIDFDGLKGVVDALGGVDVNVPLNFTAQGYTYTKGTQHMNGDMALAFVRERKSLPGGDFQRNDHQRRLLAAITSKIISGETLTNPTRVLDLVEALSPFLTVDESLDSGKLVSLALDYRDLRSSNIEYMSIPHGDPTTTSGGASVVATDEEGMVAFREALANDTMEEYVSQNG